VDHRCTVVRAAILVFWYSARALHASRWHDNGMFDASTTKSCSVLHIRAETPTSPASGEGFMAHVVVTFGRE